MPAQSRALRWRSGSAEGLFVDDNRPQGFRICWGNGNFPGVIRFHGGYAPISLFWEADTETIGAAANKYQELRIWLLGPSQWARGRRSNGLSLDGGRLISSSTTSHWVALTELLWAISLYWIADTEATATSIAVRKRRGSAFEYSRIFNRQSQRWTLAS